MLARSIYNLYDRPANYKRLVLAVIKYDFFKLRVQHQFVYTRTL